MTLPLGLVASSITASLKGGGEGPVDPPVGFRFWGVEMVTPRGSQAMALAEIEFAAAPLSPDLTAGSGGTPGAIDFYPIGGNFQPAQAFDKNNNTKYVTNGGTPGKRVWYAFPTAVVVNEVRLRAAHDFPSEYPVAFKIVASEDGVLWYDQWEVVGQSIPIQSEVRAYPNPSWVDPSVDDEHHRFWGIRSVTHNGNNAMAVAELELREVVGGPSVATGGQALGSLHYNAPATTFAPDKAFDNNNATKSVAAGSAPGRMLYYVFPAGEAKKIVEVAYRAANDYPQETPTSFEIIWSDNGIDWTATQLVENFTGLGQSERRVITVNFAPPPDPAPYYEQVIMLGASNTTQAFPDGAWLKSQIEARYDVTVNVAMRAVSGWTSTDLRNNINSILGGYSTNRNTIVLLEIGGNDITANRPHPGGAATLASNLDFVLDAIAAKGFDVALVELTFRDYDDNTISDESKGSLPYNVNVIRPRVDPAWQDTDGRAYVNYYDLIKDNYVSFLQSDNIHLTSAGNEALRQYVLDRFAGRAYAGFEFPEITGIEKVGATSVTLAVSSASMAVPVPSGVAVGDLLICSMFSANDTVGAPAGWAEVAGSGAFTGGGFSRFLHMFSKIATATEAAGSNQTFTQSAAGRFYLQMTAFRHDDGPLVVEGQATAISAAASKVVAVPALTAGAGGAMAYLVAGSVYGDTPVTSGLLPGWEAASPSSYSENRLVTYSKEYEEGGITEGTVTFTQNNGGSGERVAATVVKIRRPAP